MSELGGIVEIARIGDDDPVARAEAAQDLDLGDGCCAELHGRADRLIAAHDINGACRLVDARAALELEHVVALIEHDAHGGALVLAQARRLRVLNSRGR